MFSVRAPVGRINVAQEAVGIGRRLCSIRALDVSPQILEWALECSRDQLHAVATGSTYDAVSVDQVRSMVLPLPIPSEQNVISTFLAPEVGKIDALVDEQKRLIELLKEKREALISHAVTKGLNPNAPMKHSGLEWLGEVPEQWNMGTLVRVAKRVVVGIAEAAAHAYAESGVPILRSTNVRAGRIIGELLYVDSNFAERPGCAGGWGQKA